MFDLGDESYRIHWLIWIQILIMFLLTLTILLSYFGLDSESLSFVSSSSPSTSSLTTTQVAGNRDVVEVSTGSAGGMNNSTEGEDSSGKDLSFACNNQRVYHPCTYFDLAKQAFLKCLGLGSTSPDKEHDHQH